jgi:hypothetical protein
MTTTLDLPFQLGQPQQAGGITMTPLFPLQDPVCDYVSLDEALAGGLQISEVNEAGDVGELAVRNPLDRGVLLYDGEELVGAKQNRVLNTTVLVAAHSHLTIPVSCVEQAEVVLFVGSWKENQISKTLLVTNARHTTVTNKVMYLRKRRGRALGAAIISIEAGSAALSSQVRLPPWH